MQQRMPSRLRQVTERHETKTDSVEGPGPEEMPNAHHLFFTKDFSPGLFSVVSGCKCLR